MVEQDAMDALEALVERQAATKALRCLHVRIQAMGSRWGYTNDELAEALHLAQEDPASWLRLVDHDERFIGVDGRRNV